MRFSYDVITKEGKRKRGEIDAESLEEARDALRKNRYFIVSITRKEENSGRKTSTLSLRRKLPVLLSRQLASLLRGGVPLYESLVMIASQARDGKERKIVEYLSQKVREGTSLSDALKEFRDLFDDFFIYSVKAGEKSGALASILNYLADLLERDWQLRSRIKAALLYPAIILCVGIGVLFFLLTVVVPMMVKVFERLGHSLPLTTKILIGISGLFKNYSLYLVFFVLFVFILVLRKKKRGLFERLKASLLLRAPLFGEIYEMTIVTRFTRILSTLLKSGVPMLQALVIVSGAVKNPFYQEAVSKMAEMVEEGKDLSLALKQNGLFPGFIGEMVRTGERSGNLEEMLDHISSTYEATIQNRITTLTSLVEPLVILVIGGFVAFVLVSTLLPLFEINKLILKR